MVHLARTNAQTFKHCERTVSKLKAIISDNLYCLDDCTQQLPILHPVRLLRNFVVLFFFLVGYIFCILSVKLLFFSLHSIIKFALFVGKKKVLEM